MPTRSSAARAGSHNSASLQASRQNRNEWPAWACTASVTFCNAVKFGNSEVIWNERASPIRLRSWTRSAVMSLPSNSMRPAFGTSSPASWLISVVLPAPFGPMMACNSPLATSNMTLSEATMPPKRLVRPSTLSIASATAQPHQDTVDAAARVERDREQHRAEDEALEFGEARQPLFEEEKRHRADHGAEHRAHAAEHRHHHEIAGADPAHHRRIDEVGVVGEKHAREAADHPRDDEAGELVTEGRKADGAHAPLVGARALDHHAEARIDQPPDDIHGRQQQREAEIVEKGLVREVDPVAELAALVDRHAVVAAVAVERDGDVVGHLREGQRDHDEVDAAGAQAQRADHQREH